MASPLSINVKPFYCKDWEACLNWLKLLDPVVLVVCVDQVDHFHYIQEAQAALSNTKIVARFIDQIHDGGMHLAPQAPNDTRKYIVSPTDQLNRTREYGRNGLIAYYFNEPDTKASLDDLNSLADHTITAMDLAASREFDMALCVCNFGIGHPKPENGYLPTWMHPILTKLNEHHNRHYYGLHAYLPMDILEHLKALKKTCERLKIPMPRCIITEFGFDNDGTNSLNGFKSRGITAENFATWCVDVCQDDFRSYLESGTLLGICTFIYGDDASWKNYNVETGMNGEVSTAWRDTVLTAKRAGDLDMVINNIQNGRLYHIATKEAEVPVYLTPAVDATQIIGRVPNDAIVVAGNAVRIGGDTFIQVKYPSFKGQGWILKASTMKFTETVTMPVFRDEDPSKVDTKPLPALPDVPPSVETPPAAMPLPENAPTPPLAPKMGYTLTPEQIATFEDFRRKFVADRESRIAQVKNVTAEIEQYTHWITTLDVVLSQAKV